MIKSTSIPANWTEAQDLEVLAKHLGIPEVVWTLLLEELSSQFGRLSRSVTEVLQFLLDEHSELLPHNIPVAQLSFLQTLAWIEAAVTRGSYSPDCMKKIRAALDKCRSAEYERIRLSVLFAATPADQRWFLPFVKLHKRIGTAMVKLTKAMKVRHPDFPKSTRSRLREILGRDED